MSVDPHRRPMLNLSGSIIISKEGMEELSKVTQASWAATPSCPHKQGMCTDYVVYCDSSIVPLIGMKSSSKDQASILP